MEVGRYCKAYQVKRFREYPEWRENVDDLPPRGDADANARSVGECHPCALKDDDVLYLQESLTVTWDITLNEHLVFDDVTPAWRSFCEETLGFRPPSNLPPET